MAVSEAPTPSSNELLEELLSELGHELEPLPVKEGVDRYLKQKQGDDITQQTLDRYEKKLDRFKSFCEQEDIQNLNELTGRVLDHFDSWYQYESTDKMDGLATKTMADAMYLFGDFVEYLERIDAVQPGLHEELPEYEVDRGDAMRDRELEAERAERIVEYLEKFEYATLEHVCWVLATNIGRRLGGFRALDLSDVHLDCDKPYIEFKNRAPKTRLKNGEDGYGQVAISDEVATVLRDYIEHNRPNIVESDSREPLLATSSGRVASSTFRRYIYKWSRPCKINRECPVGKDPSSCESAQTGDDASGCPSSRSPHDLRHGYVSEARRNGVRVDIISGRCDMTPEVLKQFYDESSEEERREVRRKLLDNFSDEADGYL